MPDEERIEQLELENKVLQDNNKGLKTKIDEQSKEIEELKASHITTNNKATNTEKVKMLSDEEKEALRNFKSEYETCDHYSSDLIIELDDAEIILNLIEKQTKEIEELKKKTESQPDCVEPIERTEEMVNVKWVNHNYISKDKIKAKIEELKQKKYILSSRESEIEILKSLLEKE